jgi:pyruvate dehydrogenase E2 component (dihydrolipoamide acetyltransferase)
MAEFVMPILGADMEAGTLVEWRKQLGDRVQRGDIIAEVESDKADIEVEVFLDGVIEKFLIEPGEKVAVGTPLAIIREDGGPPVTTGRPEAPKAAVSAPVEAPAPRHAARPVRTLGAPPVSPAARELARELGVDLSAVRGTGPDGRIQRRDVLDAAHTTQAAPSPPAPSGRPTDRQLRMRQAIAAAMARSAREIPHFHISSTIDMNHAVAWLREENARRPVTERLLYGVLLLKAVALALHDVPELNGTWRDDQAMPNEAVNIGVAISLRGGGLVAPAIHDTDKKSLSELMTGLRDLVKRARAGSLRSSEISDPTITLTSLGETGAEEVYGLIYPPQVALVGFGRLTDRVVPIDGTIVVRPTITATLSADHRVVDGHRGGVFLAAVERLLQEPQNL